MTRLFEEAPRISWKPLLERIALLPPGEHIELTEIGSGPAAMNRIRATVSANRQALRGAVKVRGSDGVIKIIKLGGKTSEREARDLDMPEEAEPAAEPVVAPVELPASCRGDKACPFPPGPSGLCRQHRHSQDRSLLGSSLSGKSLEGV